jgi:hypothetical protein
VEAFGSDVTELAVVEDWGVHIFLHFADETKAGQALAYYNAMPKRMASFTSERAVKLLARVKRTVT